MARSLLTIDLDAIAANWRALDAMTDVETAAVIKADAYGLGVARVGPVLLAAGAKTFFVALAEEGVALREAIGPAPEIYVFSGLMPGDEPLAREAELIPLLNSPAQVEAARRMAMRDDEPTPVGLQLDSGMNRLGLEAAELDALLDDPAGFEGLELRHVMSHLACADEPAHPLNAAQRDAFAAMTDRAAFDGVPRSLAATGGVLLGAPWRFEMTRPGVGLYGGMPFAEARPVVRVETPIIQTRDVAAGEIVGYGAAYETRSPRRIATVAAGYADGWLRTSSAGFTAWIGATPLPSAGRVSMDLITLDVTDAPEAVEGAMVELLGERTRIDHVADAAGTIGYEILTSLGARYQRVYTGG